MRWEPDDVTEVFFQASCIAQDDNYDKWLGCMESGIFSDLHLLFCFTSRRAINPRTECPYTEATALLLRARESSGKSVNTSCRAALLKILSATGPG